LIISRIDRGGILLETGSASNRIDVITSIRAHVAVTVFTARTASIGLAQTAIDRAVTAGLAIGHGIPAIFGDNGTIGRANAVATIISAF
jgi:hypothetical protein